MSRTMTLNGRISGALGEVVAASVGDHGVYENVSEYVRDVIRRDRERAEGETFQRLKAELRHAFAAPEDSYQALDADTVIKRGRRGVAP
jgi:antitoxin ParD1/3/4